MPRFFPSQVAGYLVAAFGRAAFVSADALEHVIRDLKKSL